ncbi:MAG: hypothetical protein HY877_08800 [Deltaproteobacteria bacterium]|nr:hypothetical protein [Deltaproteobacteria bacterium]
MSTEPVKPIAIAPVSVSEETSPQESPRLPKIRDIRDLAWDFLSRLFYFGNSADRYAPPVPVFSPVQETYTIDAKGLQSSVRRFEEPKHELIFPDVIIVGKKKKSGAPIVVATKEEIKTEVPKKDQKILAKAKKVNLPTTSPMAMSAETEKKKVAANALLLSRTDTNFALSISIDPRSFSARSVQGAYLFSPDSSENSVRVIIREAVAQMVGGLEDHHAWIAEISVFVIGPWSMVHSPLSDFPGLWSVSPPMSPQILNKELPVKIADFGNRILSDRDDADPMPSPKKFAFDVSITSISASKRGNNAGAEVSNPLSTTQESVLSSESQVTFVGFPVLASNGPVTMAPSQSSHRTDPLVLASTDPEPSQNGDQEQSNNKDQGRENPGQEDGEDEEFPT